MKAQNNPRMLSQATWHRYSERINIFQEELNAIIKEFEYRNRVKLVINSSGKDVVFEKIYFEEIVEEGVAA